MVSELSSMDSDRISVRLNSKNYALWEFQVRIFIEGKGLLSFLDGTSARPTVPPSTAEELTRWTQTDARVKAYLLATIDPTICLGLRLLRSARDIWVHLAQTYTTTDPARQFEITFALARLEQGEMDVTSYYNEAQLLWTEQDLLTAALCSATASAEVIQDRQRTRLMQFLSRLKPEFESVRANLLQRENLKLDGILTALVREETRLRTQAQLDLRPGAGEAVFAAVADSLTAASSGQRRSTPPVSADEAFAVNRPQFHRRTSEIVCHHCRQAGHLQKFCRQKNFCVYCKKKGHIITDCRLIQPRQSGSSSHMSASPATGGAYAVQPAAVQVPTPPTGQYMTSEAVEQLVNSALQRSLPTAITSAFATLQKAGTSLPWLLDSACFNHMTGHSKLFKELSSAATSSVQVANGQRLSVKGVGPIETPSMNLSNTLCVPNLVPNLVSVGQLTEQNCRVVFDASGCVVQDLKTGRQIGRGSKHGRVFQLEELSGQPSSGHLSSSLESSSSPVFSSLNNNEFDLWHSRLGHPHSSRLVTMFKQQLFGNKKVDISSSDFRCTSCVEAKSTRSSFPSSTTVISEPFHIVHTDLWGPAPTDSRHGYKYFALFVDHATRFTWVYFLRLKSDLYSVATDFLKMIQTQFGQTVRIVRSDPGGEFSSHPLDRLFRSQGILTQKSCPGVSQQNGLVERKNRHVVELTRAMLLASHVPARFWPEAVATAVRLINYQITPVLGQLSPHYALFKTHPDYSRLRVFGCTCFVLLPRKDRSKLSSKTSRCVFLGYSDIHKGYLCYDPSVQRLRISCDVVFFERLMFYSSPPDTSIFVSEVTRLPMFDDDDEVDDILSLPPDSPAPTVSSDSSPASSSSSTSSSSSSAADDSDSPPSTPPAPRRSLRATKGQLPIRYHDFVSYHVDAFTIPTSYKQAMLDPNWNAAMQTEFDALHATGTWEVVDRPPEPVTILGNRWVYAVKVKADGTLERFRARLVVQGFGQEYGLDYDETFAPVAKMQTVRTLLAVAAVRGWPLFQLDVKNAFLHGDLKEVVYMKRPPGYTVGRDDQVCRLRRSLYGLKQAPRAWFEKFQSTVLALGFKQSTNDPSLFLRSSSAGIIALLLYVDDMIITGDDASGITHLKEGLHASFTLKELGSLSYFLGLEITRSSRGILLSQRKYIADLLSSAQFGDCIPVTTPMEVNLHLARESGVPLVNPSQYRHLVGSLIYLTHTRPDISFAVHVVSQFMSDPRVDHLAAVHRILRYLQGTREVGLFLPATGDFRLQAYSDSDYAGCVDTRRSTTGWCVQLGGAFVNWRCKKQDKVSKSSTEAEYRAMSDVASELVWMQRLLLDLGVSCPSPITLHVDNTSAIQIAVNPVLHDRTKHIEVHVHYVRDLVHEGFLVVRHVSSADQLADLFTKPFHRSRHMSLSDKLMLRDQHQFGGGC
ncbi:unnamed protein product [Linum trigynum]|uniref:Integrase catalytic domain-containing protein n=1 Tax=Linum trigynum TaxID=586398 RepID=A0AAV2FXV4_9ROSI